MIIYLKKERERTLVDMLPLKTKLCGICSTTEKWTMRKKILQAWNLDSLLSYYKISICHNLEASHIHNGTTAVEKVIGKSQSENVFWLLLAAFSKLFLERYVTMFLDNVQRPKPLKVWKGSCPSLPVESAKYWKKIK